jgi:hypothetical protein
MRRARAVVMRVVMRMPRDVGCRDIEVRAMGRGIAVRVEVGGIRVGVRVRSIEVGRETSRIGVGIPVRSPADVEVDITVQRAGRGQLAVHAGGRVTADVPMNVDMGRIGMLIGVNARGARVVRMRGGPSGAAPGRRNGRDQRVWSGFILGRGHF